MINKLDKPILDGLELSLVDPGRLVWRLNRHSEDLGITVSGYIPQKITWWDELKAGYNERSIKAKGRYDLTQALHRWPFPNKDVKFGTIFVEQGLINEGDCNYDGDYERIALLTRREFTLKNGIVVPPTKIEIIAEGTSDGYYSVYYTRPRREDRHPHLAESVKTHWFLSDYFRKALKEQEQERVA